MSRRVSQSFTLSYAEVKLILSIFCGTLRENNNNFLVNLRKERCSQRNNYSALCVNHVNRKLFIFHLSINEELILPQNDHSNNKTVPYFIRMSQPGTFFPLLYLSSVLDMV